jgi:predicted AAA+ superfamily ATPase
MYKRILQKLIEKNLKTQKVSLLLGARRVGKTVLLQNIFENHKAHSLWLNGEDSNVADLLNERSVANYKRLLNGVKLLIIDEAQYIPDISRKVKLMIDNIKPLHIIITGSSSFDLVQMGEPLTGRSLTYQLYSLAVGEYLQNENLLNLKENLEDRLIFGTYPELSIYKNSDEKSLYLNELVNNYLLKDILVFDHIRNAKVLKDLLKLLAFQIGSEVSSNELGNQLNVSKNTVDRYLDLLEKSYIIFSLGGYSNNLRKEVSKSKKWYFFDNGIRNALINNFQPLALRNDKGALWEQYFLNERNKRNAYKQQLIQRYFWRTYDQQEIDLIEASNNQLNAFECKWKPQVAKTPIAFLKAYPTATFHTIHPNNYLEWCELR